MSWIEICISVTREAVARAETGLEQLGALAVTLEDGEDYPVLEPEPGSTPLWPLVQVRGLFEADIDRDHVLTVLQALAGMNRSEQVRWRAVADQDWERAWMDRFGPMQFGKSLWIVPTVMQIPYDPGNIEIRLDPGLAFGTGTHPTTALCLEWIDGQDVNSKTVVDYGCGSGILGIAAAKKGAGKVICVDNDVQALEATGRNALQNEINSRVLCMLPAAFSTENADIVMANILAAPLIELAPVLTGSLRPGGRLVLSGILAEQADGVAAAFEAEMGPMTRIVVDGWVLLHGRKIGIPLSE
jgi:ribosomal protein L11 methyltransferase